ncbi:hypothetical protein BJV74DRAFT_860318 [Russula compacta]|nr:hypothetical protein BJV74DRAFT_860318 [Russula compacta]
MLREWDGSCDRILSIEMVEAVGTEDMDAYWAAIDRVLKKKDAASVIQGTTIAETRCTESLSCTISCRFTGFADHRKTKGLYPEMGGLAF